MRLILICFLVVALMAFNGSSSARANSYGPHLTFNVTTGEIYSHRKAFDRWYPASLTKMMTAFTVFREIRRGHVTMQSPVRISARAMTMPPTKMGFPRGTILTVQSALKIILVKSANDVSTALAESVGGSEVNFAALMNRYAAEIGMEQSHFVNPHGLHDERQYASAYDLGLLARQIYREFPQYQDLFNIAAIKVGRRTLRNHNALIRKYPGTIGLKTGFICAGGVSLAASIKKGDEIIVSIVLGETRGRVRNLRTAEYLSSAKNAQPGPATFQHLDELKPKRPVMQPIDIRDRVCGRNKSATAGLMFNDLAIEYFPVKVPAASLNIEQREAKVYGNTEPKRKVVDISLGGADGPDPYELLIEKPPISLAGASEGLDKRFETKDGKPVAIPTRRPTS